MTHLLDWSLQGFQLVQMALGTGCIGEAASLEVSAVHHYCGDARWQPIMSPQCRCCHACRSLSMKPGVDLHRGNASGVLHTAIM